MRCAYASSPDTKQSENEEWKRRMRTEWGHWVKSRWNGSSLDEVGQVSMWCFAVLCSSFLSIAHADLKMSFVPKILRKQREKQRRKFRISNWKIKLYFCACINSISKQLLFENAEKLTEIEIQYLGQCKRTRRARGVLLTHIIINKTENWTLKQDERCLDVLKFLLFSELGLWDRWLLVNISYEAEQEVFIHIDIFYH